jgi:hypothetical protein
MKQRHASHWVDLIEVAARVGSKLAGLTLSGRRLGAAISIPTSKSKMIVHHRESTDGHGEDFRKFLEPIFEPFVTVVVAFSEQERLAYTARHAVIPAGQRMSFLLEIVAHD